MAVYTFLSVLSERVFIIPVSIRHRIQKEPSVRTALSCKVLQRFICRICSIFLYFMPVESEYQVAEDTKKYRRCHQEAGYLIEKPEESPETDDGDCRPHGRYAS